MSALLDRIHAARQAGDPRLLASEIPFARWLGLDVELSPEGDLYGVMRYSDQLIGNASLPALHGGSLSALLEWTAVFEVVWRTERILLPKTISITFEYLRPGRPLDTRARALITRRSRRVTTVRVEAFQKDPARPVATANALLLVVPSEP